MTLRPPTSTLFPYTTLFRSHVERRAAIGRRLGGREVGPRHGRLLRRGAGNRGLGGRGACCARFGRDRKSTRLNSSHLGISYAVFCLKKKKNNKRDLTAEDQH